MSFLNIAPHAEITSSSEFNSDFQDENVVKNPFSEWAPSGQTNPWVPLTCKTMQSVDRISIKDRINLADNATGGTLTFGDGSSIAVSGIPNDGTVKQVTFPGKTVSWIRFQVSGGSGPNVGLREIKAFRAAEAPPPPAEE